MATTMQGFYRRYPPLVRFGIDSEKGGGRGSDLHAGACGFALDRGVTRNFRVP